MHRQRTFRTAALIAAVTAGLLAAAIPALPAIAASATVHGVVTDRGHAVAGVHVGYTDPGTRASAAARTDAHGRFTIHLPSDPGTGFVWAGVQPRAERAVFTAAGTSYVRAVIGSSAPSGAPSALFQNLRPTTPAAIGGGGTIRIHLQRSSRLAGMDQTLAGSRIVLRRGDGSLVDTVEVDAAGRYRSPALAAGKYVTLLRLPGSSASSPIADVALHAGRATALSAGVAARVRHRQSVVSGTVVTPKGVAHRHVRVEAWRGGKLVAAVRSDTHGRYVLRGLPAGSSTLIAGRNTPNFDGDPSRVHITPDDTLATSSTVVVRAAATTHRNLRLGVAGHVSGSTAPYAEVLVEDATGKLLRTTFAGKHGAFGLGGLPTGDYTVIAAGGSTYGTTAAHVIAGRTTPVGTVSATTPLLTAHGTVPVVAKAAGERISVSADLAGAVGGYDTAFGWSTGGATPDAAGAWSLGSFIPGRWTFVAGSYLSVGRTADSLAHANGATRAVELDADSVAAPIALGLGPTTALLAGSFRSTGGLGIGYQPSGLVGSGGRSGDSSNTASGAFEISAVPGGYRWPRSEFGEPASDGPWWAIPTDRSITVSPGITRGLRIPLTIHG